MLKVDMLLKYLTNIGLALLLFCSCNQSALNRSRYVEFLRTHDKELSKSVTVNGVVYTARYLPGDYMALREISSEEELRNLKGIKGRFDSATYFELIIESLDPEKKLFNKSDSVD